MRLIFPRQKLSSVFKLCFLSTIFLVFTVHPSEGGGGAFTVPPLEEIVPLAIEKN